MDGRTESTLIRHSGKMLAMILAAFALMCLLTLNSFAQACSTILRNSASLGGCDNIYYGWIYTGSSPVVSQKLVYGDGFSPVINTSVRSYSRMNVGCGFHSRVTITQTYANGQTCSTSEGDNHNRPCEQCTASGLGLGISVVSAASFRTYVAENSIASAFNDNSADPSKPPFTAFPQIAGTLPLPATLGGVSVTIDGQGVPLFFVSPGQVNFYVPYGFGPGLHSVRITNQAGMIWSTAQMLCTANAVATFTQDATGQGKAAVVWLVIRANGTQGYYAPGNRPALNPSDIIYLVTFSTGIVDPDVTLILANGRRYSGRSYDVPGMTGLQQQNFRIGINELWASPLGGYIQVRNANGTFDGNGVDFFPF